MRSDAFPFADLARRSEHIEMRALARLASSVAVLVPSGIPFVCGVRRERRGEVNNFSYVHGGTHVHATVVTYLLPCICEAHMRGR